VVAIYLHTHTIQEQSQEPCPSVCKLGIAEEAYYRWRKEYGGLRMYQARRLKELEGENTFMISLTSV
jgi:hypothetical protein